MFGFMRRWRPSALLASWVAYWFVLACVGLGPAAVAIWKATRGGPSNKADFSLNFGNGVFSLIVHVNGKVAYSGAASMLAVMLLIAVPPLVLWALWLSQRPRRADRVRAEERV